MSVAVASMTSPHQLPLGQPTELTRASPTKGYKPPATRDERQFAEGAKSSPSKNQREEPRGAYRAQSIKAIQEVNGDVGAFLEEVDTKRRQLDEQIHRYIKQKDREFKLFERDARIKYRNAGTARQPSHAGAGPSKSGRPAATNGNTVITADDSASETTGDHTEKQDALQARSQPRLADNGLRDPQVAREREADLLGVFTPSFLPLLSTQLADDRPPSAPASLPAHIYTSALASFPTPLDRMLHRANSDPVDEKDIKQTRIKLEKRTSSSGSESKNLVSVLKSPAANARGPKRKRVSLVVGDDIVAPSDNVNSLYTPDDDNQLEHAEHVECVDFGTDRTSPTIPEESINKNLKPNHVNTSHTLKGSREPVEQTPEAAPPATSQRPISALASALATERRSSLTSHLPPQIVTTAPTKPEPDVFNFSDTELAGEDHADRPPSDIEDVSDVSPAPSPAPPEDVGQVTPRAPPARSIPPARVEMPARPTRPVPKLRTSSSSSSQPVSPGFSRPSVKDDPVFPMGENVTTPEIEQNEIYGSMSASMSLRAGSLGESFMERNAEELKKSGKRRQSQTSQ